MELQLVTFKQAKALKELGFPQETFFVYDLRSKNITSNINYFTIYGKDDYYVSAPSLELIAKWLREEKNIELLEFIHLEPNLDSNKRWNYRVETTIFLTYEDALSAAITKSFKLINK